MSTIVALSSEDLVAPARAAIVRGLVREAEVMLAGLALWALERVEAGTLAPDDANNVFVEFDLARGGTLLTDDAADLLVEGEHFHHWGGEYATDPAVVRELAERIMGYGANATPTTLPS